MRKRFQFSSRRTIAQRATSTRVCRRRGRSGPIPSGFYFFSAGFGVEGVGVGLAADGLSAGLDTDGVVAGVTGAGSSVLQPTTQTIAGNRLETINPALITDFTVTDALLEKHVLRQGVSSSLSQLAHASGPSVVRLHGKQSCPIRSASRIIDERASSPQRIIPFFIAIDRSGIL
jgi:hypothetical protein